jgi:hypothetical protein
MEPTENGVPAERCVSSKFAAPSRAYWSFLNGPPGTFTEKAIVLALVAFASISAFGYLYGSLAFVGFATVISVFLWGLQILMGKIRKPLTQAADDGADEAPSNKKATWKEWVIIVGLMIAGIAAGAGLLGQ